MQRVENIVDKNVLNCIDAKILQANFLEKQEGAFFVCAIPFAWYGLVDSTATLDPMPNEPNIQKAKK